LKETPDPDTGLIYEKQFVSLDEVNNILKWNKIGEIMFKSAKEILPLL